MCLCTTGCDSTFTETPSASTTLLPGDILRLDCKSDTGNPVQWLFTAPSGSPVQIFISSVVPPAYQSLYEVDTTDGGHDLVARTSMISSYCGTYECVENNGVGPGRASATVAGRLHV